jgi:glutathione S-transferase
MAHAHLYGLAYSPWTERARWALDHHGVVYRYHEHVPMLGEPLLRMHAKPAPGQRATVPLFIDDRGERFMDSLAIIERADRGASRPLVADLAATRALAAKIEPVLRATRGRVTARILADPEALRESATAAVPAFMAGLAAPVAAQGAKFIAKKHDASLSAERESIALMRALLTEVQTTIDVEHPHTRETLTAEDILVATLLHAVRPAHVSHITLGPASRRAWSSDELATEFSALLAWRDALYQSAR